VKIVESEWLVSAKSGRRPAPRILANNGFVKLPPKTPDANLRCRRTTKKGNSGLRRLKMTRFLTIAATALLLSLLATAPALAENPVTACGDVLSEPGNYGLTGDLLACPGNAIVISASNVSLNLKGHSITCGSTDGIGVLVTGVSDVQVKNGTITGCGLGVFFSGTTESKITHLTLNGNGLAISLLGASDNKLTANHMTENITGIRVNFGGGNRISENVASDNFGFLSTGIALLFSENNTVTGNRANRNNNGIIAGGASTGTILRGNVTNENRSLGISMFGRLAFNIPIAEGVLIQGNTALGNGDLDMVEALFDPSINPPFIVVEPCRNTWKSNNFVSRIGPDMCIN
jgi:parallel beta-helix repeat protein